MNAIAAIDLSVRYSLLFLLGLIGGSLANYVIYTWAYFPRPISPWISPCPEVRPRRRTDRLPVFGWLGLRRESAIHGRGFWIRPLLIEIGCGFALPAMYWFYTQTGGLLPPEYRTPERIAIFSSWAHSLFVIHGLLFLAMVAATFIDFDEQSIPDAITLPGTLIALVVAAFPWRSFLPARVEWEGLIGIAETTFNIPWVFDERWNGWNGLVLGLGIWAIWLFSLTDRRLILRHGWVRAAGYLALGICRQPSAKWLLALGLFGTIPIFAVWLQGAEAWRGLLSALIGLAVGGGTVWAVRIVAGLAMGQEAMGFGDVTLMAMIGAFLGWQVAIAGFFLAPLAAIAIVIVQFVITRQPVVPFGPYLCMGTVIAVLCWHTVWNETLSIYVGLGWIVVWILMAALFSMGAMLMIWRQIKRAIFS